MTGRDDDFEELRPAGEASQVPDDTLSDCGNGDPRRQREAVPSADYPEKPTGQDAECRSCGATIPASQSKCRFCLTNRLGDSTAETDGSLDQTLQHVIFVLVEATSSYEGLAKGRAAAAFVESNADEPAMDECRLINDLDTEPAPQLEASWPALSPIVEIASTDGEQLLAAARDRTVWEAGSHEDHAKYLYDETGGAIRDEQQLNDHLAEFGTDGWLVPAMALQTVAELSESRQVESATSRRLDCRSCEEPTAHRFRTRESLPDEQRSGQPIWKCRVCRAARYGPDPT